MENKILGFYQFREINPETNEEEYLYLTQEDSEYGPVFIFTHEYGEAKAKLRNYAIQHGCHTAEELLEQETCKVDLSKEEMIKIAREKYGFREDIEKSGFNFFDYVKQSDLAGKKAMEAASEKDKEKGKGTSKEKESIKDKEIDKDQESIKGKESTKEKDKEKEKNGLFARIKKKVKKIGVRTIAIATAVVTLGVGFASCKLNKKNSADGKTAKFSTTMDDAKIADAKGVDNTMYDENTADFFTLLSHTQNQIKHDYMSSFHNFAQYFNIDFAVRHSDFDKDTKLCLSTEEMSSLYLAYNGKTLNANDVYSIYDKSNLDSATLIDQYKSAYLQMMLAATVQTETTKLDTLITSQEGKAFYQKYENMNIAFNTAKTEEEKQSIAASFVAMAKEDFHLDQEQIGFEHQTLEELGIHDYSSSVLPIIAAMNEKTRSYGENMSFTEDQIAQLNSEALCDVANQNINSATDKLTMAQVQNQNDSLSDPSYDNFMRAEQESLNHQNAYNLDDRDISNTNLFKDAIPNGHIDENTMETEQVQQQEQQTSTSQKNWSTSTTSTNTETSSKPVDRAEAVQAVGEEEVRRAEQAADEKAGISQTNEEAKQKAEQAADEEQKRQQEIEDKKSEEIDKKIEEEENKIQDDLNQRNDSIDNGDTKGTDQGAISDITTDSSGSVDPDEPLPDPNADEDQNETSDVKDFIIEEETPLTYIYGPDGQAYPIDGTTNYEELANKMVEDMANQSNEIEEVPTHTLQ